MLSKVINGNAARDLAYASNQLSALGGGDDAARIQQIEEVRAFQAMIIGSQNGKAPVRFAGTLFIGIEQLSRFLLVQLEIAFE